jgi:hypothetical protein
MSASKNCVLDGSILVSSTTNETLASGPTIVAALQSYFPSMSTETAGAFVAVSIT